MNPLDFLKQKIKEVQESPYFRNVFVNTAAQAAPVVVQKSLLKAHDKQTKQEASKTPMDELKRIARKFDQSIAKDPNNSLNPGDIKMTLKEGTGEYDPIERRVISSPDSTTFVHELGHAYNSGTPEGKARQAAYGRVTPKQAKGLLGTKLGGIAINAETDADSLSSIATGVVTELLDPDNMSVLKEEASAWKRGKQLAQSARARYNPLMAGTAFATYPTAMIAKGVQQGVYGWLAGQTIDKGLKGARDFIIDPLLHRAVPELSSEEKALQKYGYNRNDYRFTGDLEGGTWKLDKRFGKR